MLIWASAYIPAKTFVFPFSGTGNPIGVDPTAIYSGDGRPGPQIGVSSRAYHLLTIETDASKPAVVRNTSGGGISQVLYTPGGGLFKYFYLSAVDLAPPLATVTRNGSLTIVTLHEASNDPLVFHAPDIIYDYTLVFASCGKLHAFGDHTHFPAFDIVIDSTSGQKVVEDYRPTGVNNTPAALLYRPLIWFDSGLIDY